MRIVHLFPMSVQRLLPLSVNYQYLSILISDSRDFSMWSYASKLFGNTWNHRVAHLTWGKDTT